MASAMLTNAPRTASELCCRCNLPKEPPKASSGSSQFRYICRLCLMRAEDVEPIFIHPGDKTLANKIFACTGVEVDENATVGPTNICMACKSTIYKSYQFLELCQRNNKIIQNLLASHEKTVETNGSSGNGLRIVIRTAPPSTTSSGSKKSPPKRQRRLNSRRKSVRSNSVSSTSASEISWSDCDEEKSDPNEDVDEVMPFRSQLAYETDTPDDSFKRKRAAVATTEERVPLLIIPRNRLNSVSCEERNGRASSASTVDPAGIDDQFQCEFCYVSFPYRLQIRQHIDIHHADRKHELSCKSCSKSFFTTATLRKHVAEKHAAGPIGCDLCQRTFTSQQGLHQHYRSIMHRAACGEAVYPRRRRSSCISTTSTNRRNSVSAGYESDTSPFGDDFNPYANVCYDELVTYQCDYCELRFDDRQSLARHTDVRPCQVELEPLNLDLLLETMDLDELLQPLNSLPDVTIIEPPIEIVDLT